VPYCTVDDLLLDPQFGLPMGLSKEKYVQYGAEKIDARLGRLYETPLMKDWTAVDREEHAPTVMLLKMMNQYLASGMIILAISMASEDSGLNAYGASLVAEADNVINLILENEVYLEGAKANPNLKKVDEYVGTRPASFSQDSGSATEAFYEMVNSPTVLPRPYGNLFRQV
jgi:hypothetical protein